MASESRVRSDRRAISTEGTHWPAERASAIAPAATMVRSARRAACALRGRAARTIASAAAPIAARVTSAASGAPATICSAWPQPQSTIQWTRRVRNARTAKSTVQGIQAAPASWFQTGTCEASGPEQTHTAAATHAAVRENTSVRERA